MLKQPTDRNNTNRRPASILALVAGILAFTAVQAQDAPIHVKANKAELTETTGESVYIGNVDLRRGDLIMKGDRLKVIRDPRTEQVRAILVGSPATITQPDRDTGKPITAKANQIDYYSDDELLLMKGNAQIIRGAERMAGERIRYYANTQKIIADESRIEIVIDPNQHRSRNP